MLYGTVPTAAAAQPAEKIAVHGNNKSLAELEQALAQRGFASLQDAVGYAHRTAEKPELVSS